MLINKKFLSGGDQNSSTKDIEIFLSIIIIGYFGVKIVYGLFFGYYPEKYYYRNIEVTTNEGKATPTTENITLNAYIPGMWNNEMSDFVILLVLSFVVYIYTNMSQKSFIDQSGSISFTFLLGYIIGLGYPPIYTNYKNLLSNELQSSTLIKYIYLIAILGFIMFVVVMNYSSINGEDHKHRTNYVIYVIVIVLLFGGLLVSKKNSKNYNSVTYFYNNGEKCAFNKYGVLQSSGDLVKVTVPFTAFIILLLFSYEPSEIGMKSLYIFIYGLLLGILVSSVSYYGIEYFLQKHPQKQCEDLNECILKDMPVPQEPDKNASKGISNEPIIPDKNLSAVGINFKIPPIQIAIIITLVILTAYLIYFFLK